MILDFIRDNLDGDSWEKWCDACYRDRFQDQNYFKYFVRTRKTL